MIIRTSSLTSMGHPEFEITFSSEQMAELNSQYLETTLHRLISNGNILKTGEIIQIGWGLCRIVDAGLFLGLEEPDFESFPITWVPGPERMLMQLRIQSYTAESVGLLEEQDFPSIQQSAIVCNKLCNESGLLMERIAKCAGPSDSGWSILCLHSDHDHEDPACLSRESLYAIALRHNSVFPYVSLPMGSKVIHDYSKSPLLFLNELPLKILSGSYLSEKILNYRSYGA